MDMAFVNAINTAARSRRTTRGWRRDLNYYYLGHLAMAMRAAARRWSRRGYNCSLALLFGLTASALFTLAGTLWAAVRATLARAPRGGPVVAGLVAAVLVASRQPGGRARLARRRGPPADYDWFAPSRVIPGRSTSSRAFSFLLGDLHAHVLALPFTVLALAFSVQVALLARAATWCWRGGRRAWPPAWQSARSTRSTRGRIRWRRACSPPRWSSGCATRRAGRRCLARSGRGWCWVAERRAHAPVLVELRPGGARDRLSSNVRRAVRQVARATRR